MTMLIEYRVRPVTRYVITRFETSGPDENGRGSSGCSTKGEFDTEAVAYEVGYALCKAEHESKGWAPGDERILYPIPPDLIPPDLPAEQQA